MSITKLYGVDFSTDKATEGPYVHIPFNVLSRLHDYNLSDSAFRVYSSLLSWGGYDLIFPPVEVIGTRVGKGRTQTFKALLELLEADLINRKKRRGTTSIYSFNKPLLVNNPYGNPKTSTMKNRTTDVRNTERKVLETNNSIYKYETRGSLFPVGVFPDLDFDSG
jgi:hypothetical protein